MSSLQLRIRIPIHFTDHHQMKYQGRSSHLNDLSTGIPHPCRGLICLLFSNEPLFSSLGIIYSTPAPSASFISMILYCSVDIFTTGDYSFMWNRVLVLDTQQITTKAAITSRTQRGSTEAYSQGICHTINPTQSLKLMTSLIYKTPNVVVVHHSTKGTKEQTKMKINISNCQ